VGSEDYFGEWRYEQCGVRTRNMGKQRDIYTITRGIDGVDDGVGIP
jgi:hypothetical protein